MSEDIKEALTTERIIMADGEVGEFYLLTASQAAWVLALMEKEKTDDANRDG